MLYLRWTRKESRRHNIKDKILKRYYTIMCKPSKTRVGIHQALRQPVVDIYWKYLLNIPRIFTCSMKQRSPKFTLENK